MEEHRRRQIAARQGHEGPAQTAARARQPGESPENAENEVAVARLGEVPGETRGDESDRSNHQPQ
jgi:hypothetical protein